MQLKARRHVGAIIMLEHVSKTALDFQRFLETGKKI